MKGDRVSINGAVVPFGDGVMAPDALLAANFVYQKIHTLAYRPLQAQWAVEIAETSYRALYGRVAGVDAELLAVEAGALLRANNYPAASTLVSLYFIPDGPPVRLLSCDKQLVYKGYALSTGLRCTVVPYEWPLSQHKTALSLAAHTYAADYARRKGFDAAIAVNGTGAMVSLGDNPLFAVVGDKALTLSIEDGAADSVERRLGIAACEDAGLTVCEHSLSSDDMERIDELFGVTPQGIASIRQIDGRLLPHSLAKNLLVYLKKYE